MVICVHDICWFKEIPAWNHDIYIYIYLDVPEGLVDFCPLAQICLFIQEAFFWLLERCIITDVFSRIDASFLLKFEDVSGQGWIIN
jgi:hypothetical protein